MKCEQISTSNAAATAGAGFLNRCRLLATKQAAIKLIHDRSNLISRFRALANVNSPTKASTQLAYSREPAIRNIEVSDGVLRVRGGREDSLSLANLAASDASESTKVLGVVLRPATTGVGASTLRRAAISGSVARNLQQTNGNRLLVSQDGGNISADVAAIKAIRSVLGKLDLSAPQELKDIFYSRK